ncbi:UNVERIFIED_CONTAM: DUF1694 domain-containing protein [Streptococcus canis]|uniref:DUF1694 domain-containing protein n=1 Tax=Streptococcus canis TaxID=1329 RepID=UPI00138804EF|nr:DUF1694 domain-containing protein [Streptococcus canis]QKG75845.1 DUF1694 domain-containing protein [Streptococcus canis]GFG42739.1 hypothetical protein ScFU29_16430 [Streptococcus canis]
MDKLEDKVLKRALSDKRLDPDQQRYYLGTYAERVILSVPLAEATNEKVKNYLETELANLSMTYQPLALKISSELAPQYQILYMKLAKQHHLTATIVTEKHMTSPFGFILHTDHAINLNETRLDIILKQSESERPIKQASEKPKSFWQKFFQ